MVHRVEFRGLRAPRTVLAASFGSILRRLSSLLPRPYLFPRSPPFGEIAILDIGQREGKVLG